MSGTGNGLPAEINILVVEDSDVDLRVRLRRLARHLLLLAASR